MSVCMKCFSMRACLIVLACLPAVGDKGQCGGSPFVPELLIPVSAWEIQTPLNLRFKLRCWLEPELGVTCCCSPLSLSF